APLFPYTTLFRSRIQAIPLAPTRPGASAIKEAGLSSARSTTMPQLDQIPAGVAQARYTPLLRGRAGARPSRERPCSHPGRVLLRQPTPAPFVGAPVSGANTGHPHGADATRQHLRNARVKIHSVGAPAPGAKRRRR